MQKGRVRKYERENIFDTMKTDEKVSGHVLCGSCDQPAGGAVALYRAVDVWLGFLKAFAAEHPEVNIHTILPREENIKKVLAALSQIEEKAQSVFTGETDI